MDGEVDKNSGEKFSLPLILFQLSKTNMKYTRKPSQIYILKIFYLFIFREGGREEERERNINVCLPLVGGVAP